MQSERAAKIFGDKEDPRRRLADVFGGPVVVAGIPATARDWALTVLREAGVDPAEHLAAVRRVREAEPRLTLKAATYLVHHLVAA